MKSSAPSEMAKLRASSTEQMSIGMSRVLICVFRF